MKCVRKTIGPTWALIRVGIICTTIFGTSSAHARPALTEVATESCSPLIEFSETVMTQRQNGTKIRDISGFIKGEMGNKDEMTNMVIALAFTKERYFTKDLRREAVGDFVSMIVSECISTLLIEILKQANPNRNQP